MVVGTWTDGMFFFGQRPGRGGRIKDRLPAMAGKQAVTYVTFALEPRHALDKLTDIVRATGADVIGGMAIRRDDIEGGATDLVERVLEATASQLVDHPPRRLPSFMSAMATAECTIRGHERTRGG